MKKLLFSCILLFVYGKTIAQIPFNTIDSITINNVHASVLVHGDMSWDPLNGSTAKCVLASHSNVSINFASSLWMSGYDASGDLHVSAQTYRQDGNDYWPGPISSGGGISYDNSQKWAKIWKVNKSDIETFRAQSLHTLINTDLAILIWPGKDNAFAKGNNNEPLVVDDDMAPFVDLNGNGQYEPLAGEYPAIKGDQALWWVFNDRGPSHSQSNGNALGIQVRVLSYGYNRGTLIDDVVYYEYSATNRSANNYSNFRMAIWDDAEIGNSLDDYIGFDSVHRMGVCYNGTDEDGAMANHPSGSYGTPPPMVGVSLVELPGDEGVNYVPAGSFMYYNNDASIIGNPIADTEYNNYIRSEFRTGIHLQNDCQGDGIPVDGLGAGPLCNYVYTGTPGNNGQWSECAASNTPGDRRFILSSNDFSFNAGATKKMVWALVVADSAGGCGAAGFSKITAVADTAWAVYHGSLPLAVAGTHTSAVAIYPNPAHDKLYIKDDSGNTANARVNMYNSVGKLMPLTGNTKQIDISSFPVGLYHIVYSNGVTQQVTTVVKQ